MTEDEIVGWHHRLNEQEFEQSLGVGDEQGGLGLIPGLGRSPGEGNGIPLQYSCLGKKPMDRGAWRATVHGVAKCQS